jgi:hypothetical protein
VALMAAVIAVVCPAPRVEAADTVPDWFQAAAQEKLPDYPKDTVAVILLDDRQTTVSDNGQILVRVRRVVRFLRPEARDDYGGVGVDFDNETKVLSFKAWTITKDGKNMALTEKDATERSLSSFEVFSDDRAMIFKFPEALPGSVVGYEYVQKMRPFVFDDVWIFQHLLPVHCARMTLQLPTGWEFTTLWANHPELKPESPNPNEQIWEVTDSPAIEEEPRMPPWPSIAAHMELKYFPRDPAMRAKTSGSWKDIGLWYSGLTQTSRQVTPQIAQKVTELTAGTSDPVAKMRALTSYVQTQIRYAAIEIGIGGYQPHMAGDVFAHQYGDCKDKATLLGAMLHQIGIESYYVLVDTHRGYVLQDFPSTRFNHAILAIKLPDGIVDSSLDAVVNDPTLGRLLFVDPTNEYISLGNLPPYLQDGYGLVIGPNGGQLFSLPLLAPSTNRLLRTAKFTLSSSGGLSGEVNELRSGGPAADDREDFLENPPSKREKVFEDFLGASLGSFVFQGGSIGHLEEYDQNLTLEYKFDAEGYAKSAGDLMIVRPRVLGDKGSSLLNLMSRSKPRQYPIEFEEATRQDDIFDIVLPSGYVVDELPKPVEADCAYGTYRSNVDVTDGTLHYKRSYIIKDVVVPTDKLGEVNDFLRQIAADQNSSAVLRRISP